MVDRGGGVSMAKGSGSGRGNLKSRRGEGGINKGWGRGGLG